MKTLCYKPNELKKITTLFSVGAPHGMHDPYKYPAPLRGERHKTKPQGFFKTVNNEVSGEN